MSSITVLQAVPSRPLTKTISVKELAGDKTEYIIGQYDQSVTYFSGEELPVGNFDDLAKILDRLIKDKYRCVIRGVIKQGVAKESFKRRKVNNPSDGAIEDVDQNWVCIDIDSIPLAGLGCSLKDAPAAIRELLPTCFRKAKCWWNFSPSQGFKPGNSVSIHMWFWLNDETSNAELKRYFALFNESCKEVYGLEKLVDTVTFDSIQIHYTAPPDLINTPDPLPVRHGVLPGDPEVKLTEDWIKTSALDTDAIGKHLSRIGDDKDGFHSPILSASALWVRMYGSNEKSLVEFKAIIRDTVQRSNKNSHTAEQIDRYTSDSFLEQLIRSAAAKGFDKNAVIVDSNAVEFFKGYVYCEAPHKFFKIKSEDWTPIGAFDQVARRQLHMGNGSKVFIDAGGEIVDNVFSVPGADPMAIVLYDGKRVFNKWRGRHAILQDQYNVSRWEDHIAYLCDGRNEETELLLNYFAFIIANPGKKVNWVPIVGSEKGGTGKSVLKIPLRKIFGKGIVEIGTEDIHNSFNGYMESELIFVEEVYGPENRKMVNMIKAKITETVTRINIKNVPQYDAPNFANFVMFTNHRVPFPIDPGDRRFFLIFSEISPKNQEYYDGLAKWLSTAHDDIYTWAMRRDLSKFNNFKAPLMTREKSEAILYSNNSTTQRLLMAMADVTWPLQHDVINPHMLLSALNNAQKYQLSYNGLVQDMRKVGMRKFDTEVRSPTGARIPVWIVRDFDKYEKFTGGEMFKLISEKNIGYERDFYSSGNI